MPGLFPNAAQRRLEERPHQPRTSGRCSKNSRPVFEFSSGGATYIGVGAPIFSGDQPIGAVVLAKPLADVNNAWKNVIGLVAAGVAVGLIVAIILATYVARRITQPLRVLGGAADKVARGDLDVNVIGKRTSDDELGQLATRFQGMVDRLREVDELERNFLMRVTHELRTPLTAISGHVQALAEGVVGPDDLDESLTAVNEEVRRLDRLVGDLLDLTRLEAHQFRVVSEEVGLAALLERAAASFREKARTNDVIFHTPIDEAPTIITDGDRVLQIVNNLLDNAFRWTPRGGTVQLGCSTLERRRRDHACPTPAAASRPAEQRGRVPPVLQPPRRGRHRPRASRSPASSRPRSAAGSRSRASPARGRPSRCPCPGSGAGGRNEDPPVRHRGGRLRHQRRARDHGRAVRRLGARTRSRCTRAAAAVAHVPDAELTPAELFALGHALLDAAADGFGHFVPADEVFGLDLAPPSVPAGDRRGGRGGLGRRRPGADPQSRRAAASPCS